MALTAHSPPGPLSDDVVLIGIGEMGSVFAKAFLQLGASIHPIRRGDAPESLASVLPKPSLVLVAVGEADLDNTLESVPNLWRDRLMLIQNELLPQSWNAHSIANPTVGVVWFEKKPGQDVKVIISSPIGGPASSAVVRGLRSIGIAAHSLTSSKDLARELIIKNVYILTSNLAGLDTGGTVFQMWKTHNALASAVAEDVLDIQEYLLGCPVDRAASIAGMVTAIDGDPDHQTTGRSALQRLARALHHADAAGLEVATLRDLAARHMPKTR